MKLVLCRQAVLGLLLAMVMALTTTAAASAAEDTTASDGGDWYTLEDGEVTVDLYFYWSPTCPHCQAAKPFIEQLIERYPWIELHSYNVTDLSEDEIEFAEDLLAQVGESLQGVPAFLFCESLYTG